MAAALANPRRRIRRFLATLNGAQRVAELAEGREGLPAPEIVRADEISRLLDPDAIHQGLYLECDALGERGLEDLAADGLVVALDQITDPHNVGAIVRSAAAFGADALLTTHRHSPGATGVLAKSASGGLERLSTIRVRNLAEALIELGERGFLRLGLDAEGSVPLSTVAARRPLVLVLGAEGPGLRQRTRTCCDVLARIEMPGAFTSLNVSNAAAVALYHVTTATDRDASAS